MTIKQKVRIRRSNGSKKGKGIKMAEYHVGCGVLGIYAGTLKKDKKMWQNKTDVTDEAIEAVRDYMVSELLDGFDGEKKCSGYEWTLKDGRVVTLGIKIAEKGTDVKDSVEVHTENTVSGSEVTNA